MKLPAGIMPNDTNIEIFADPDNFGKCFWTSQGKTNNFWELDCLRLNTGLTYQQIAIEMGFRRVTAVNSLFSRLHSKFQCANNIELALKVKELGLV